MSASRDMVADFLIQEAALLDDGRYRDWAALFAADGYYWMPVDPTQTELARGMAHIIDDRQLLEVRALRLEQTGVIPQTPPSRCSRLVGNVRVEATSDDLLRVRSTLHMVEYRPRRGEPEDDERLYAATVRHALRPRDGGFEIAWKRVDLVNAAAALRVISIPL